MDTRFVFPRPQAAVARPVNAVPRPPKQVAVTAQAEDAPNRDSNALRASVLETALELGIGGNNSLANWMFTNTLAEEEEEDEVTWICSVHRKSLELKFSHSSRHLPDSPPGQLRPPNHRTRRGT